MWENVQIFVYRVSDSHKCLLQKVTPTIKSLFAIESNAACKICLCFRSYIQFRKLKMTAGTQCRSFFLFLFIFATWVVNTHHESESLPSPCFHTKFFFLLVFFRCWSYRSCWGLAQKSVSAAAACEGLRRPEEILWS